MELKIKNIPTKRRSITEEEKDIIEKALLSYQIVLGQYEKYTDEMKRKDLERISRQNNPKSLDLLNPFSVDMSEEKTYEPTLEDTKEFVYSSWAEAIANVRTPYICDGAKKRRIRKQSFRDVQCGKFMTKKIRDVMDAFIARLYNGNGKSDKDNE